MASTLDRTLTFEENLDTLHSLIDAAKTRGSRFSTYLEFRPLLITLEEFLRKDLGIHNQEDRRELRLLIVGLLSKRTLETFYDLPVAETKTIQHYLSDGINLTQRGRELLTGVAKLFEGVHSL